MSQSSYVVSPDTTAKVEAFKAADAELKQYWSAFESEHQRQLEVLESLRERRNVALDEATRALREEAFNADIDKVKFIACEPFSVTKKESKWYVPETFCAILSAMGLYDSAVTEGVVAEKTEVDYKQAKAWLRKNSLEDNFVSCEDGTEMTPAISGPKPIPAFCSESKGK